MKRITFVFPTYDSMWQFKDKSKAINVEIIPKKNTISGLFDNDEIELAVKTFQASSAPALREAV